MAKRDIVECNLCGKPGYPYTITALEGLAVIDLCDRCKATNSIAKLQQATMSGLGEWLPRKGRPRRRFDDLKVDP